jgi:solute:Na+ symporter, SSS family
MVQLDLIVMAVFAVLILAIGMAFTRRGSKNAQSFFEAGGETPWWINGLSLFISYFSAGTFVVWGSIAYKAGFVANGIQLTMVFGGLLVAWFIAKKWKRTGALTAAEYIGNRFNTRTQQFYTFLIMLHGLLTTASVLYPVGKMVQVATPLSLEMCIIIIGGIIVLYTSAGGLWAVLVTDVVQFVILTCAVLIVIPMAFTEINGVSGFIQNAPKGFFNFSNDDFPIGFLLVFMLYQTAYIGGNWAYVQRYTSVSSEKNAQKVAYLFAGLYFISPFIWMLPPMIYRIINPNLVGLEPEGAYMMLCQKILPAGLIGLVLSGMISATASKANTTINLVATVFANDVYRKVIQPQATEKSLIFVARVFTVLFGALTIWIAILVPKVGGIVEMVLSTASIAGGALFVPIIWSLYSKRPTATTVVTASLTGLFISLFLKFAAPSLLDIKLSRTYETAFGIGLPFLVMVLFELYYYFNQKTANFSLENLQNRESTHSHDDADEQNSFGVKVILYSITFVGLGIVLLGCFAEKGQTAILIGILTTIGGGFGVWKTK